TQTICCTADGVEGEVDKPKIRRTANHYRYDYHIPNLEPRANREAPKELLDDHRELEPPDPIPNSAVKRLFADGSVGFPHVRVGHRQAPNPKTPIRARGLGFCLCARKIISLVFRRRRDKSLSTKCFLFGTVVT